MIVHDLQLITLSIHKQIILAILEKILKFNKFNTIRMRKKIFQIAF